MAQENNAPQNVGRVVVGVDGSPGSRSALHWAIREAQLRDVTLHAVFAWKFHTAWRDPGLDAIFPTRMGGGGGEGLPTPDEGQPTGSGESQEGGPSRFEADEDAANGGLDAAIGQALEHDNAEAMRHAGKVTQAVPEGDAKDVLLAAVTAGDLLVVGSGDGEHLGGRLGSTARHIVSHAPCPVVVVPDADPQK